MIVFTVVQTIHSRLQQFYKIIELVGQVLKSELKICLSLHGNTYVCTNNGVNNCKPMQWFQKGCLFSLVVFTKKVRKLHPELWCIASRKKLPEKNISSFQKHCVLNLEYRILSQEHNTISNPNKSMSSLAVTKTTTNFFMTSVVQWFLEVSSRD